jgi:predicted HD phosphohydrolase
MQGDLLLMLGQDFSQAELRDKVREKARRFLLQTRRRFLLQTRQFLLRTRQFLLQTREAYPDRLGTPTDTKEISEKERAFVFLVCIKVRALDEDGSGLIEFDEFVTLMR